MRQLSFVTLLVLLATFNKFTSSAPSGGPNLKENIQQMNIYLFLAGFYGLRIMFHWDYNNAELRYVDAEGVTARRSQIPQTGQTGEGNWLIRRSDHIGHFTFSMLFVEWPVNLAVQHNGPGRAPPIGTVVRRVILNGLISFRVRQADLGSFKLRLNNAVSDIQYEDFTVFDPVEDENGGRATLLLTSVDVQTSFVRVPCQLPVNIQGTDQLPRCPTPETGIDVPRTANPVQPQDCVTNVRQIGDCSTRDPCQAFEGIPDQRLHQLQYLFTWSPSGSKRPRVSVGTITRPASLPRSQCNTVLRLGQGDYSDVGQRIDDAYQKLLDDIAYEEELETRAEDIWTMGYIDTFEIEGQEVELKERETQDFLRNFGGVEVMRHELDLSLALPGTPPPPPPGRRDPRKGKDPLHEEFRRPRKACGAESKYGHISLMILY